jgi:glycosyltransferase involved in cell wall biosynthesis
MKQVLVLLSVVFSLFCVAYEEKPIVVVIPSYNNVQWYERNLNSVCFQKYSNYRIIYIDDCSTDGTGDLVRAYIAKHKLQNKVMLICNETNCGAMANHYRAAWMCADNEIIVHLDGDDFFKHNNVLARINREYQNPDVWLTYGQFENHSRGKVGFCRAMPAQVIQANAFREHTWITSHVRTFYAGLFKQIKLSDFIYEDAYFDMAPDLAMMFPLLELAGKHIRFIPDVLYIYNDVTPLNEAKRDAYKQFHCNQVIRSRIKSKPVATYTVDRNYQEHIDAVLFVSDLHVIERAIEQLKDVGGIMSITVFYQQENDQLLDDIRLLYKEDHRIAFLSEVCMQDFFRIIQHEPGYILLAAHDYALIQPRGLIQAIRVLESTQAVSYTFGLRMDIKGHRLLSRLLRVPSFVRVPENILAWRFASAEYDWRVPFGWTMNLCRKADFGALCESASFNNFAELQDVLHLSYIDANAIGLCNS